MPDCVPAELLALSRETQVEYSTGIQAGGGITSVEGVIYLYEERIARRRSGRYSLREAAAVIEAKTGEDASKMIDDLAIAAVSGELRVHERDKNATFRATAVSTHAAKSLDSTASQLNAWLAKKHPLVQFRFQDPTPIAPFASAQSSEPHNVGGIAAASTQETQRQRRARRYQMGIDAGLPMPDNDYAPLPRGIGKLADKEGVSRQTFAEDVKAHIRSLMSNRQVNGR